MKNNSLSVVVPCYNSKKRIIACINAIKLSFKHLSHKLKLEIIVINDGSTDGTDQEIKNLEGVQIITHSKNKGLSSARNSGIEASRSEYVAFIDSDIEVEQDWFEKMLTLLKKDDSIMGVTGHLRAPLSSSTDSLLAEYLFSNHRGAGDIDEKTPLLYNWFVFSNTVIRRRVLEKTGFFDEKLISYGGEDTELAIRINKIFPNSLRKCGAALSVHYYDKDLSQYKENMFEYGLNNFNYIVKKHPDYKKNLRATMIFSIKGYLAFNPINEFLCFILLKLIKHPLLVKFLVINSFVRGARLSKNSF
jgi:glycosyltransferase involved in cell wall biosynthesis